MMSPEEVKATLAGARFKTLAGSPYPYYVIQLTDKYELELEGHLVSDALCEYLRDNPVTHVFIQTHGWNTPPEKAVAVPFSEFISGMQDDHSMPPPETGFSPIFIAFIWQALPISFFKEPDALTRAELVEESEKQLNVEDSDVMDTLGAARHAVEENDPDSADLNEKLICLVEHTKQEQEDDDSNDPINIVSVAKSKGQEAEDLGDVVARGFRGVFKNIFRPVEYLVFGRLMARGRRSGKVMQRIIANFMNVIPDPTVKFCLMANSLGAHVLAGALTDPCVLPRKIHTVFFVQGAVSNDWFDDGGKYRSVDKYVAGPIVCTHSERDLLLLNVFGTFHGTALGYSGASLGNRIRMRSRESVIEEPYSMAAASWTSVDGTEFIDEGNAIAGGHGDFKEDETTMTYWAAIHTEVPREAYTIGETAVAQPSAEETQGVEGGNIFTNIFKMF